MDWTRIMSLNNQVSCQVEADKYLSPGGDWIKSHQVEADKYQSPGRGWIISRHVEAELSVAGGG